MRRPQIGSRVVQFAKVLLPTVAKAIDDINVDETFNSRTDGIDTD